MVKIKVYELAKELSLDSKDIILKLKKMGYEVRSHMSSLDDSVADKIRMQKDNIIIKKRTQSRKTWRICSESNPYPQSCNK